MAHSARIWYDEPGYYHQKPGISERGQGKPPKQNDRHVSPAVLVYGMLSQKRKYDATETSYGLSAAAAQYRRLHCFKGNVKKRRDEGKDSHHSADSRDSSAALLKLSSYWEKRGHVKEDMNQRKVDEAVCL